jgi:hypothetical protein
MNEITGTRKEVRKFGITFSVICVLLGMFSLYKGNALWKWWLGGSAFFLSTGLFVHQLLRPIYLGWMKFASGLGWFNTRVILGLAFFLVFTPVGLLLRLFRKDILGLQPDRKAPTYWIKRDATPFDKNRYERLF